MNIRFALFTALLGSAAVLTSAAVITELIPPTYYKMKALGDSGVTVHYREAGNPTDHTIILWHGFPSSSHQYRDLTPLLSDKFHIIAPDYPGFGSTEFPADYNFTFDNIGSTMADFVDTLDLASYSM